MNIRSEPVPRITTFGDYVIRREVPRDTYAEVEHLYREHYKAMQDRLAENGITIGPYAPLLEKYFSAPHLLHFTVRKDGLAVGYSNAWVTQDVHNGELIGQEDTVYVTPEHRRGVGKALIKHVLQEWRDIGVKRALVTTVTDMRVGKVMQRLGFKQCAEVMMYSFEENS